MGVAEFGRVYASTMRVTNAVKAAAQYAVQSVQTTADTAVINQVARNDAGASAIDSITTTRVCKCPDGTTPSCTGSCPSYGAPEVFVKVRARKTVAMLFKYPGLPEQFVIVDTATYRLQ
jgi:Flp pilus assembly protein TadG